METYRNLREDNLHDSIQEAKVMVEIYKIREELWTKDY